MSSQQDPIWQALAENGVMNIGNDRGLCDRMASAMRTFLAERDVHVVRDNAAGDGHRHVVMLVDADTVEALRARLFEPDMRGVGYSAFIAHAVRLSRELHAMIARAAHEAAALADNDHDVVSWCDHTPGQKPACEQLADDQMTAAGGFQR